MTIRKEYEERACFQATTTTTSNGNNNEETDGLVHFIVYIMT